MTITLNFETMSSNFVCNEAFSEGNQTRGSATPELPAFGKEDEDDDNSAEVAETLNNTTQETIETAIEPEASDSEDAPADDRLISSNLGLECVAALSALAEAVDDYRDAVDESFGKAS